MMAKTDVNGENAHEVFKYLRRNSELYDKDKNTTGEIGWNFGKFLVNSSGHVVKYYGPREEPNSIIPDIKKLL